MSTTMGALLSALLVGIMTLPALAQPTLEDAVEQTLERRAQQRQHFIFCQTLTDQLQQELMECIFEDKQTARCQSTIPAPVNDLLLVQERPECAEYNKVMEACFETYPPYTTVANAQAYLACMKAWREEKIDVALDCVGVCDPLGPHLGAGEVGRRVCDCVVAAQLDGVDRLGAGTSSSVP